MQFSDKFLVVHTLDDTSEICFEGKILLLKLKIYLACECLVISLVNCYRTMGTGANLISMKPGLFLFIPRRFKDLQISTLI